MWKWEREGRNREIQDLNGMYIVHMDFQNNLLYYLAMFSAWEILLQK